jgi:hypothetical protein
VHNHASALSHQDQPHLHFMYSERHNDGLERGIEQFFKRHNAQGPQKGGAQKLTADVLGMGKAQLQLYRQKTEELINNSVQRYAPTKMVEVRGIQVRVPNVVSCLSNRDYNNKHGTQLKDVPIMNKAVRFAKPNQPLLLNQQQKMIEEITQIRAENNYELYRSYYEAELIRRQVIEKKKPELDAEKKQQVERDLRTSFLQQPQTETLQNTEFEQEFTDDSSLIQQHMPNSSQNDLHKTTPLKFDIEPVIETIEEKEKPSQEKNNSASHGYDELGF